VASQLERDPESRSRHPADEPEEIPGVAPSTSFVGRLTSSKFVIKIARYAIGSGIALATSTVVFFGLVLVGANNTTVDSVAAFAAGAIPNWILNRRWAWEQNGKTDVAREVVGYSLVSLGALAASSYGTGLMQHYVRHHVTANSGLRAVLITGAYVGVQALLFVVKYVIYDRWVFAGQSRFRAAFRSRR
jgi:putative flippase GtrA